MVITQKTLKKNSVLCKFFLGRFNIEKISLFYLLYELQAYPEDTDNRIQNLSVNVYEYEKETCVD